MSRGIEQLLLNQPSLSPGSSHKSGVVQRLIHAHQPQLVDEAQRARVWMVSPTTLMAVLTTARAVLKDSATRKQVHVIQDHLVNLAKDFDRFRKRMDNLSRHIHQANKDVEDVHKSATKISSRFDKIEKVELKEEVELLDSDADN